ncbi:MAG: hypothetical protein MUP21_06415 [Dehalococcoidia bacterium]|jgi:hypothetical protein|nr:hypothetical protein [Dehalococcoidia bacterium]
MKRYDWTYIVWIVLGVAALLWILGLALGWGGWLWIFFVIGLAAAVVTFFPLISRKR